MYRQAAVVFLSSVIVSCSPDSSAPVPYDPTEAIRRNELVQIAVATPKAAGTVTTR